MVRTLSGTIDGQNVRGKNGRVRILGLYKNSKLSTDWRKAGKRGAKVEYMLISDIKAAGTGSAVQRPYGAIITGFKSSVRPRITKK